MSKQILIVSDFHLANGEGPDDFGTLANSPSREAKLIAFMNKYDPQQIYINGDILELWQVKMKEIKVAHPTILNFIDTDPRVVKIVGNHDYALGGTLKVFLTTENGKKICITHGFDAEKRWQNKIGRFFCWILGKIEYIFPRAENVFANNRHLNKGTREKVMDFGEAILNDGYDIVVCAHSHGLAKQNFGQKIYANSGTCQEGKLEGVLIDLEDGTVTLVTG